MTQESIRYMLKQELNKIEKKMKEAVDYECFVYHQGAYDYLSKMIKEIE